MLYVHYILIPQVALHTYFSYDEQLVIISTWIILFLLGFRNYTVVQVLVMNYVVFSSSCLQPKSVYVS